MSDFYLSIIAASRNDDHGGQLLARMQSFIDGVIAQSKRHALPVELIIVEWNPPEDRPPLSQVLKVPTDKGGSAVRIIRVSKQLHCTLDHSDSLPLFQMYAKNVGIRRARGKYVIATNIDIIFSDEIFSYFKKKKLKPGVLYRVDRLDIPANLPQDVPFENILQFCSGNFFRINSRFGTKILNKERPKLNLKRLTFIGSLRNLLNKFLKSGNYIFKLLNKLIRRGVFDPNRRQTFILRALNRIKHTKFKKLKAYIARRFIKYSTFRYCLVPHSNACGDFTLLSRKGWEMLRGYPEWTIYSLHLDSIFLYQALLSQFKEKNFGLARPIYHIEHEKGSGYTPEGFEALLDRLNDKKVPYLDMDAFDHHFKAMKNARKHSKTLLYNGEDWGMMNEELEEVFM